MIVNMLDEVLVVLGFYFILYIYMQINPTSRWWKSMYFVVCTGIYVLFAKPSNSWQIWKTMRCLKGENLTITATFWPKTKITLKNAMHSYVVYGTSKVYLWNGISEMPNFRFFIRWFSFSWNLFIYSRIDFIILFTIKIIIWR